MEHQSSFLFVHSYTIAQKNWSGDEYMESGWETRTASNPQSLQRVQNLFCMYAKAIKMFLRSYTLVFIF